MPIFRMKFDFDTHVWRAVWTWPNGAKRVVWEGKERPSEEQVRRMSEQVPV